MPFFVRRGVSSLRRISDPWHIESDADSRVMICGEVIGYRDASVRASRPDPSRLCEVCLRVERNLSAHGEPAGVRYRRAR